MPAQSDACPTVGGISDKIRKWNEGFFFILPVWIYFFISLELLHEIVAPSEIKQWFALEGIWDILDAELLRLFD